MTSVSNFKRVVQTSWLSSSSSTIVALQIVAAITVANAIANNFVVTTVIVAHGIIASSVLLNLIQKEYIEQFYFEKGSGGGGTIAPSGRQQALLCEKAAIIAHSNKFG